jgi:hypothetical protein
LVEVNVSREELAVEVGADASFARRLEAEGVLPRWPAADREGYRARLKVCFVARKNGVTLATVRRALGGSTNEV